ncbi:MarC family protein [Desulfuromonas sp. AOP6]|uniref:MarC family protein n=1 Tax=Desulfuromonas sp. AOP6 TaxID=1566351 RepID=UPI00126EA0B6|nr:MarC family protein [Desulfuromonas sp. AOP6]BCA78621.1 UPF0056 inner membrane protein [Desulfuromonas sp. AOP6]
MTILSATLLLLFVMDPIGNIPLFLTALKDVPPERQKKVIIRELFIALLVLVLFLFLGKFLLHALNISDPTLTVAGGIILFMIAIRMVFPSPSGLYEVPIAIDGEPFIVPLAIPFIAGPSALASVVFIMNRDSTRWPEWLLAIFMAWLITGTILSFSTSLNRWLGKRGIIAIERLMGMILTTLAVQMIMGGVSQYLRPILSP